MKITDELKDGIVIIGLEGKVMGGPDATMFHGKLHEYVSAGNKNIIVNLAKVEWMSSVGLGMLISALTTLKNNEGQMRLVNVTENIESLLTITRLITIFKTQDSIEEAISSFE